MADPVNTEYRTALSDWIAVMSKKTDEHIQAVKEQTKIQAQTMHSQSSMIATQLTRIESKDNDYQQAMTGWAAEISSSLKVIAEQSHYLNDNLKSIADKIEGHSDLTEQNHEEATHGKKDYTGYLSDIAEAIKEQTKTIEKQRKTYIYHMDEIAHILRLQDSTADYKNELLDRLVKVVQNPDRVIRKD